MASQIEDLNEPPFDHLTRDPVTIPGFEDYAAYEAPLSLDANSTSIDPDLDFTIKKSPLFGSSTEGTEFDEGATWFPLKRVFLAFSDTGLLSIQSHYEDQSTGLFGSQDTQSAREFTLDLKPGEYITGLSGFATEKVTNLTLITSDGEVHVGSMPNEEELGTPFSFKVPEDHMVIGFFGRADKVVNSLGVSYQRRLESIAPKDGGIPADTMSLTNLEEQFYVNSTLKGAMRTNNNAAIDAEKARLKVDLQPIYTNIKEHGESALVRYWIPRIGEYWYVCKTENSSVVIYTRKRSNIRFIAVDSYSGTTRLRGASGWTWENLDVDVQPDKLSFAGAKMTARIYSRGLVTSPSAAATDFADCLNQTGDPNAQAAARRVPASVRQGGGLVIVAVLASALWSLITAIGDVILREYHLKLLFVNFASAGWKVVRFHGDNHSFTDGVWREGDIPKFKPRGTRDPIPRPGGEEGVTDEDAPGRHVYTLLNNSRVLEGVGIAMAVAREGSTTGFALKYDIRRFRDNKLGLKGNISPNDFNLRTYFEDNNSWGSGLETTTTVDGVKIYGVTNALNGARNNEYSFGIQIGTPPQ